MAAWVPAGTRHAFPRRNTCRLSHLARRLGIKHLPRTAPLHHHTHPHPYPTHTACAVGGLDGNRAHVSTTISIPRRAACACRLLPHIHELSREADGWRGVVAWRK